MPAEVDWWSTCRAMSRRSSRRHRWTSDRANGNIRRRHGDGGDAVSGTGADANDPNLVKVVVSLDGRAIYFSRSPIPHRRDAIRLKPPPYYLHLGIYAYRRDFLLKFASWPPTPLETTEKLEQLRAIEHGRSIYVLKVDRATHGIDTPRAVRGVCANDFEGGVAVVVAGLLVQTDWRQSHLHNRN